MSIWLESTKTMGPYTEPEKLGYDSNKAMPTPFLKIYMFNWQNKI